MADISNIEDKITDVEVGFNQPVSEQLNTRYGGNINNLIDENNTQQTSIDANTAAIALTTIVNVAWSGVNTGTFTHYTVPAGKIFLGGITVDTSVGVFPSDIVFEYSGGGPAVGEREILVAPAGQVELGVDYSSHQVVLLPGGTLTTTYSGNATYSGRIYGFLINV